MRVVTWNVERKRPGTPTGRAGVERLARAESEIAVITEARIGHLDSLGGYEIAAQPPPGDRFAADERKVIAWSRTPWRDVDGIGCERMPAGRFVAGTTTTSIGDVRVIAVCIPWHMCDVRYGSKDRKPWEQHLRWLRCLAPLISEPTSIPTVVAGDFNQRIPARPRTRKDVVSALDDTLRGYEVITAGVPDGCSRQGIDHIAIDHRLQANAVGGWPNDDGGVRMSDHDAAFADLAIRG